MRFEITFSGHHNIRSLHPKTVEITTESELTPRGDCIVGVNASAGCDGIPAEMKERLRDPETRILFGITAGGLSFRFEGRGHPGLELSHPTDIVVRKSGFVCPRTAAVGADRASDSIPREMVRLLQDPRTRGTLTILIR